MKTMMMTVSTHSNKVLSLFSAVVCVCSCVCVLLREREEERREGKEGRERGMCVREILKNNNTKKETDGTIPIFFFKFWQPS